MASVPTKQPRHRKWEEAIAALMSHASVSQAARAAGLSDATLERWLRDGAFQRQYRQARHQLLDQTLGLLVRSTGRAVLTLVEIMGDASVPPSARVSACRSVLDYAIRGAELSDLESRIRALEEQRASQSWRASTHGIQQQEGRA